jgi:uncharacterized membrane protein YfbV (UPF0208 family)
LEHRIPNQFIYRLVKQAVIPVAAKTAGFYYELKRRRMMKDAILRMAEAAA